MDGNDDVAADDDIELSRNDPLLLPLESDKRDDDSVGEAKEPCLVAVVTELTNDARLELERFGQAPEILWVAVTSRSSLRAS